MTHDDIRSVDIAGMAGLIREFPAQVRHAVAIGDDAALRRPPKDIRAVVVCGLGGSAIGGDLLRSYLADELRVPFIVNRHYTLPAFVGPRTLVVVSSYSGNTEETVSAHREALRRKAPTLCITSGGTTAKLAGRSKAPLISVPGGLPPRAALGYSFFPLLAALGRWGIVRSRPRDIRETIALLEAKAVEYGDPGTGANRALQLAELLRGRLSVVYASTERLDAVATRWRGQIAENGKSLMFGNVLPEMNHNELVGWKALTGPMERMQVLFLRDRDDHRKVQLRMEITKEIVARHAGGVAEVWSEGKSMLARIFSLVHLGDWTSLYLAVLHREDPTPVEVIDHLKRELAGARA